MRKIREVMRLSASRRQQELAQSIGAVQLVLSARWGLRQPDRPGNALLPSGWVDGFVGHAGQAVPIVHCATDKDREMSCWSPCSAPP